MPHSRKEGLTELRIEKRNNELRATEMANRAASAQSKCRKRKREQER
jgi:hypothetical protein